MNYRVATDATAAAYWERESVSGEDMALLCAGIVPGEGIYLPNVDTQRQIMLNGFRLLLTGESRHCRDWLFLLEGVAVHGPVARVFLEREAAEWKAKEVSEEPPKAEAEQIMPTPCAIRGKTFARLQKAINAFPARYPKYATRPPKLDDDVRQWLKEAALTETDAERRVFGTIIREHFKLLPDTQKT